MPYKIKQNGDKYDVINKDTGEVKATYEPPDAKEKAEKQVDREATNERLDYLEKIWIERGLGRR